MEKALTLPELIDVLNQNDATYLADSFQQVPLLDRMTPYLKVILAPLDGAFLLLETMIGVSLEDLHGNEHYNRIIKNHLSILPLQATVPMFTNVFNRQIADVNTLGVVKSLRLGNLLIIFVTKVHVEAGQIEAVAQSFRSSNVLNQQSTDVKLLLLKELNPRDINSTCSSSREFLEFCYNQKQPRDAVRRLLKEKIIKFYPQATKYIETIPGREFQYLKKLTDYPNPVEELFLENLHHIDWYYLGGNPSLSEQFWTDILNNPQYAPKIRWELLAQTLGSESFWKSLHAQGRFFRLEKNKGLGDSFWRELMADPNYHHDIILSSLSGNPALSETFWRDMIQAGKENELDWGKLSANPSLSERFWRDLLEDPNNKTKMILQPIPYVTSNMDNLRAKINWQQLSINPSLSDQFWLDVVKNSEGFGDMNRKLDFRMLARNPSLSEQFWRAIMANPRLAPLIQWPELAEHSKLPKSFWDEILADPQYSNLVSWNMLELNPVMGDQFWLDIISDPANQVDFGRLARNPGLTDVFWDAVLFRGQTPTNPPFIANVLSNLPLNLSLSEQFWRKMLTAPWYNGLIIFKLLKFNSTLSVKFIREILDSPEWDFVERGTISGNPMLITL